MNRIPPHSIKITYSVQKADCGSPDSILKMHVTFKCQFSTAWIFMTCQVTKAVPNARADRGDIYREGKEREGINESNS